MDPTIPYTGRYEVWISGLMYAGCSLNYGIGGQTFLFILSTVHSVWGSHVDVITNIVSYIQMDKNTGTVLLVATAYSVVVKRQWTRL